MCGNIVVEEIKKNNPNKIFYAELIETPFGYYFQLSPKPQSDRSFKGNISQITNHIKWLNARKGYLGAYYPEKSLIEKCLAIMRIFLVFGYLRKRKPLPAKIQDHPPIAG